MKKDAHHNEELVTKGYLDHTLRYRFGRFHAKIKKEIKEESHALEFQLTQRMDERFDAIEKKIGAQTECVKKAVNTVLELADQVVGVHKNFEPNEERTE